MKKPIPVPMVLPTFGMSASGQKTAPDWVKVTDQVGWQSRDSQGELVCKDRMWIFGGWPKNASKNWGDVSYSTDGAAWTQLESNAIWKERHEHSACVFQKKLWVAGGMTRPRNG